MGCDELMAGGAEAVFAYLMVSHNTPLSSMFSTHARYLDPGIPAIACIYSELRVGVGVWKPAKLGPCGWTHMGPSPCGLESKGTARSGKGRFGSLSSRLIDSQQGYLGRGPHTGDVSSRLVENSLMVVKFGCMQRGVVWIPEPARSIGGNEQKTREADQPGSGTLRKAH